jgi:hypothetical protein
MYMKSLSLTELAKFSDQYVALSRDKTKILSSNKDLEKLQKHLEKQNIEDVIIHYIPPVDVVLSPVCL